jgi:hypothetical protein
MTNIYQNIGTDVVYTEVLKKEQPIVHTCSSTSSNDNEQDAAKVSVRDLVKRFNRQ